MILAAAAAMPVDDVDMRVDDRGSAPASPCRTPTARQSRCSPSDGSRRRRCGSRAAPARQRACPPNSRSMTAFARDKFAEHDRGRHDAARAPASSRRPARGSSCAQPCTATAIPGSDGKPCGKRLAGVRRDDRQRRRDRMPAGEVEQAVERGGRLRRRRRRAARDRRRGRLAASDRARRRAAARSDRQPFAPFLDTSAGSPPAGPTRRRRIAPRARNAAPPATSSAAARRRRAAVAMRVGKGGRRRRRASACRSRRCARRRARRRCPARRPAVPPPAPRDRRAHRPRHSPARHRARRCHRVDGMSAGCLLAQPFEARRDPAARIPRRLPAGTGRRRQRRGSTARCSIRSSARASRR